MDSITNAKNKFDLMNYYQKLSILIGLLVGGGLLYLSAARSYNLPGNNTLQSIVGTNGYRIIAILSGIIFITGAINLLELNEE